MALNVEDIEETAEGLRVTIRSKTDQAGAGYVIAVPAGLRLRPAEALRTWIAAAGIAIGSLFRSVNKAGRISVEGLDRAHRCRSGQALRRGGRIRCRGVLRALTWKSCPATCATPRRSRTMPAAPSCKAEPWLLTGLCRAESCTAAAGITRPGAGGEAAITSTGAKNGAFDHILRRGVRSSRSSGATVTPAAASALVTTCLIVRPLR